MNIAHIEESSFIYGPGQRFVIWVQGCSIHCKGCWNKEMWSFNTKNEISVSELIERISDEENNIEGITLLGGEPLDQFEEIIELLNECRHIGLSTMLFTGYEMTEITEKGMSSIKNLTDILITGRYDETKRTLNHQWIGSTNQEIHYLTERYNNFRNVNSNYVEISIDDFGKVETFGFPDEKLLKAIEIESPRYLQAHCQSRTSPSTEQSFVKELAKPPQRKIVLKNFLTLQKNKKRHTQPNTD